VLPQYETPDAEVYAIYPPQHNMTVRVRAFIEFVAAAFAQRVEVNATS
jgi:DNA-binding transcriptional LysR family regulator